MAGTNGNRKPPRPRIELLTPARSKSEAAAIVAALERFLADTAAGPAAAGPSQSAWQRAALEDGIAARQVSGSAWGARAAIEHAHRPRAGPGPHTGGRSWP